VNNRNETPYLAKLLTRVLGDEVLSLFLTKTVVEHDVGNRDNLILAVARVVVEVG